MRHDINSGAPIVTRPESSLAVQPPHQVFRRFSTAAHSLQLVRGFVWLPTFQSIRQADEARHDPEEGRLRIFQTPVNLGTPTSNPNYEADLTRLRRVGIEARGAENSLFHDNNVVIDSQGYLLCTSLDPNYSPFGDHCVRIEHPMEFMNAVGNALARHFRANWTGAMSALRYGRAVSFDENIPPHFAGTVGNEAEQEFRFAFAPDAPIPVVPIELEVPEAAKYCSLVHLR